VPTPRDWKVTIGGRIDGVTNDSRFPAFFEAALNADPEVHMIQFGEANWPHFVSAVLRISAPDLAPKSTRRRTGNHRRRAI
jgi:hypothetical protein